MHVTAEQWLPSICMPMTTVGGQSPGKFLPGIKPATFCCVGRLTTNWATPVGARTTLLFGAMCKIPSLSSSSLLQEVWSTDQSYQHHWGLVRISSPTTDLLHQNLHFNKIPRWSVPMLDLRHFIQKRGEQLLGKAGGKVKRVLPAQRPSGQS